MTTEPTEKHREEAQEIHENPQHIYHPVFNPSGCDRFYCLRRFDPERAKDTSSSLQGHADGFEQGHHDALSSRDTEIREVLEGLRLPFSGCWCQTWSVQHTPACLAARGLWERVQMSVKKEESDVVK